MKWKCLRAQLGYSVKPKTEGRTGLSRWTRTEAQSLELRTTVTTSLAQRNCLIWRKPSIAACSKPATHAPSALLVSSLSMFLWDLLPNVYLHL